MTITVSKEVKEQVEIPVPCFFASKDGKEYIGVLDENTVVKIFDSPGHKSVSNSEMWLQATEVRNAFNTFHSCTEESFLEAYDRVNEAMYLHPVLKP